LFIRFLNSTKFIQRFFIAFQPINLEHSTGTPSVVHEKQAEDNLTQDRQVLIISDPALEQFKGEFDSKLILNFHMIYFPMILQRCCNQSRKYGNL